MVGDYTNGYIGLFVASVFFTGHLLQKRYVWSENPSIVIRMFAFHHAAQAFEAHTGIHMAGRKVFQRAVSLAVVLHEHEVPYFYDLGIVFIDKRRSRDFFLFIVAAQVHMYLRRRPARTLVAHFPEIVVFVAFYYTILRHIFFPYVVSLAVESQPFFRVSFEHCHVKYLRIYLIDFREQFPRPLYCFLLKIISERPVSEHFEHRVVVSIHPHFLQVVVFSGYAQTFLSIGSAWIFSRRMPKEYILELVHSGIGKHQRRVILENYRSRSFHMVTSLLKKIEEKLSYFLWFHLYILLNHGLAGRVLLIRIYTPIWRCNRQKY